MDVVLRPINDRFFHEQVLPFLGRAMSDATGALEGLLDALADGQSRMLCERMLATAVPGGLGSVDAEPWAELAERLAFQLWHEGPGGWEVGGMQAGYADSWDEALHLALMLEDTSYPYWDARMARGRRDSFRLHPQTELGLASLMGGQWEPFPAFPPDRIFSTQGRGEYVPRESYAFARDHHDEFVGQASAAVQAEIDRQAARRRDGVQPGE